ncbi:hypothetical protein EUTSA_v10012834mg [Eutrema salsugineum]|uniref:C3H1-type domain-containing protein n=1 Tax=Eutrema salsugineum TaxID=72664 RepID=V4LS75_EUTSA|nr:zinc finger CCCH domain-containing protein 65 [Eutrema salsugineum]ESQ42718.1 hypothetical protein EUTSA_v10012834mg [Eutrema salsugineum]
MESSVTPLPYRRSHLSNQTYRSTLHHLCSSFDREPGVSLTTPAILQDLVLRTEIAQASPGETCEPGKICADEKPPENLSILEPRSDGGSGESRAEKEEKILMLGDVFDGIDLQDASVGNQHKDFFDDFELMINDSEDFVPESCVNFSETLDVNDYDVDGMAKQALVFVQNVAEKPNNTATEIQVDSVEGDDKKVSEIIGSKAEEVPKLAESNEVLSSGVVDINNETLAREMESEKKPVDCSQVVAASISQMVEDGDVEEGEISGDDNDNMLIGDDLPVERHEDSHVSQEIVDKNGEGTSKSSCSGPSFGVEVLNVENGVKEKDQTSKNQEKMASGTRIKKKSAPSKEAKARKKAKFRKKRAQERIALGVKKLQLKPVAPKPIPIKYCRHYLKGRCHEGEKCKFSHDTTPETKSLPCCYFATQSCMKGDDCPYDHDLSKYLCNNFITKGSCHRGDNCLFSHKGTPQAASDTPSANVTTSSTNITAASFSPQKSNKQTVREAIAKLPTIQARVSIPDMFLKPSSQANQRNSSDASPPQIPPLRKPSVAPKGMSFLSLEKTSQEDTVKPPSLGSKQNTQNSDNQSLKQSQQRSSVPMVPPKGISLTFASEKHKALNQEPPQESSSSRNLKTTPNSHIQSSLNSTMKLAAEFESAKVERRTNDSAEAVNKGDVAVNTSVTRNSGNIPSKILEFLSSFRHGKN